MSINKVLVTGGSGFLGSHIISEFIIQGWSVFSIDKNIKDEITGVNNVLMTLPSPDFSDFVKKIQPDLVIHAAGTASVPFSLKEPVLDFNINASVSIGLLDALKNYCPSCKVVFLSSAAVYGNPNNLPIREDDPVIPISPYGYHKFIGELLFQEYYRVFNLSCCCVRLFSAYGSGLRKQLLWDICQKLTNQNEVRLMGSGLESRDMVHAKDVAKALHIIANQASFSGETYNLASGNQITIREIAEKLINCFPRKAPLIFTGEQRTGDPLNWVADISRISKLGFNISIGLKEGLNEYALWFINNEKIA